MPSLYPHQTDNTLIMTMIMMKFKGESPAGGPMLCFLIESWTTIAQITSTQGLNVAGKIETS